MQEHFRLLDEEDSALTLRLFESPQYCEHYRVLKAFAYLGCADGEAVVFDDEVEVLVEVH